MKNVLKDESINIVISNEGKGPITSIKKYNEDLYFSQDKCLFCNTKPLLTTSFVIKDFKKFENLLVVIGNMSICLVDLNGVADEIHFPYFIADSNKDYTLLKNGELYENRSQKLIKTFNGLKMVCSAHLYSDNSLVIGSFNEYYFTENVVSTHNEPLRCFQTKHIGRIFDIQLNKNTMNNIYYCADGRKIYFNSNLKNTEPSSDFDLENRSCFNMKFYTDETNSYKISSRNYFTKIYLFDHYIACSEKNGFFSLYNVKTNSLIYEVEFFIGAISTFYIADDIVYLSTKSGIIYSFNLFPDNSCFLQYNLDPISIINHKSTLYDKIQLSKESVKFFNHSTLVKEIFSRKITAISDFVIGNRSGQLIVNDRAYKITDNSIFEIFECEKVFYIWNYLKEILVVSKSLLTNNSFSSDIRNQVLRRTDLYKKTFNSLKTKDREIKNLASFFSFRSYCFIDSFTIYGTNDGFLFLEKDSRIVDSYRADGAIVEICNTAQGLYIYTSFGYIYKMHIKRNMLFYNMKLKFSGKISCAVSNICALTTGEILNTEMKTLLNWDKTISAMCLDNDSNLYFVSNGRVYKISILKSTLEIDNIVPLFMTKTVMIYKILLYKNYLFLAGDDHAIYRHDLLHQTTISQYYHSDRIVDILIHNDVIFAISYDKTVSVLSLELKLIKKYQHNQFNPSRLAIDNDNCLIIFGEYIQKLFISN